MGEDLCYTTALELVGLFDSKRVSPVEVAHAILERIERLNPILNCYCYCNRDDVLAAARQSEARWVEGNPLGPLDGVPVSIKDLLLTKGWPTRCGSRLIDPQGPWTEDDPAVARLRESGAVLLGKMTTPEFGNSGITDSPLTGVTVNPWDTSRTTGGSSGGSVAAVASGLGPLSIGTDTGGSIRTPSSFCGLVGLKPTFGRVAQYPETDWGGISVSGPIARTASDAALLMTAIAQPDPRDGKSLPRDDRDYVAASAGGVEGWRVAFSPDLGFMPVDPEIAAIVRDAAGRFETLGAQVEAVAPPFDDPIHIFNTIWSPVLAAGLKARFSDDRLADLGDETREALEEVKDIALEDFVEAERQRDLLAHRMREFHESYDLLLTPTAIVSPFGIAHAFPPEWDRERSLGVGVADLSLQLLSPAGGHGAVRLYCRRVAGRSADCWPHLRRCAHAPRGTGLSGSLSHDGSPAAARLIRLHSGGPTRGSVKRRPREGLIRSSRSRRHPCRSAAPRPPPAAPGRPARSRAGRCACRAPRRTGSRPD